MPLVPDWPYDNGDIVFAKMKNFPPWPARIDCIRPSRCNLREQKDFPENNLDQDFHWPVFFFGTHQISWMPAKDLFHFELYRDEFGQHPSVKKAMNEVRNNCWVKFQFGSESDESGWFEAEMARNWFQQKSDVVSNKSAWDNLPARKKVRKSISKVKLTTPGKGTKELEDIPEDAVVTRCKDAPFRVNEMKIGDFIAAMYEKPYFGIVTKLNSNSITAQFYIRSKAHSVFIEKKGDLDTITEERQGYIFSHVTTRGVVRDTTLSGKQKCFILPEFIHEDFDLSLALWKKKVALLRGSEIDFEELDKEIAMLSERSRRDELRGNHIIPIGCEKLYEGLRRYCPTFPPM